MVQHATIVKLKGAFEALQDANYTSWPRHIGKVARVLNDPDLLSAVDELATHADLQKWLTAVEESLGGMVGSAQLQWPTDVQQSAGLAVSLIRHLAEGHDRVLELGHLLFGNRKYDDDVREVVSTILIPSYADILEALDDAKLIEEPVAEVSQVATTKRVFLVHGRDGAIKNEVARFLEKMGLDVTILHERPNKGRTLITKFQEESADVTFAVVLITPDDMGGLADSESKPRARQNVIFELGFFIGRLGSERVCALMTEGVERPSDYDGVAYVPLDASGGWKSDLIKELAAARVPLDFAKAFAE
ncbi:MAG: nucleotide-binding protein [Brevundimonas diminuta]|nr:nucleotide-binding protein [Brevundimonas diminuta]MBD3819717.1 nucleotide-binding protein [Brevundimonas diminuta]